MHHALIFSICENFNKRLPGGHRIATHLRQEGWDVEVIDWANFFELDELKEICRSRISNKTVFVGFSAFMSYWDPNLELFCQWVTENYPDVTIILGGQSSPRMKTNYIHYYVHGYGEKAITELTKSLIGNTPIEGIKFDPIYEDKKVINAIKDYPAFPQKEVKIGYQNRDFIDQREWLTMEFSRGCIFKCLYCNYPILGVKGDYTRSAEDFYEEMSTNYDNWGVSNYFVADETFNDYTEKVVKYADAADRLSFRPFFSAFLRGDLLAIRPQDWEPMVRLGMVAHFYGLESLNPASAKTIGKSSNMEKILSGILDAKQYFKTHGDGYYRGHISLIAGLPHETVETLNRTFNWLEENWKGEFYSINPLEIPLDPTMDRLSTLSLDYSKWGYRHITNSKVERIGIEQVAKKMMWENDNMDIFTAQDICNDMNFHLYNSGEYGATGFNLHFLYQRNLSILDCLKSKVGFQTHMDDSIFYDRLQDYKHKKLSL
jgi:radical SAM superfamily enzyme YgiQ (UPF0313 family)